MRLLLDTQILVWMVSGDRRLKPRWREAIAAPATELQVSAVIAFEYADLQGRNRLPVDEPLAELVQRFDLQIVDLPFGAWTLAADLPNVHGDPIDRMLVAHALLDGATLLTADTDIRRYPVACI